MSAEGDRRLTVWRVGKVQHLAPDSGAADDGRIDARAAYLERRVVVTSGRWHRRGTPVASASEHPAVQSSRSSQG